MAIHLNEEQKNKYWNNIINQLVKYIQATLSQTKTNGYVLGVSGGIDSAVCAALIQKACPDKFKCYYLSCYNSKLDVSCVNELENKLNIHVEKIPLENIYENFIKELSISNFNKITKINIKARLRMMSLYSYANNFGYLVVGTSNKCEKLLGYFTKYGDNACDMLILSDFHKEEIKELAKYLEIPDIIINRAPTASLYEGQTDEGDMNFKYDDVNKYILGEKIDSEIKIRIETLIEKNKHKNLSPITPIIIKK